MKTLLSAAAAITLVFGAATAAQAAIVIDFDEFTHTSTVKTVNSLNSKGFAISGDHEQANFGHWGSHVGHNADPGGATLSFWNGKVATVRRADGQFFSLDSVDVADNYNQGGSVEILFTFFDGVRTTTQSITTDRLKGLQTFDFNQERLEWFSFAPLGPGGQFDNIVLGDAITSAVPEPATWAMMILGLGGVGAVLRSRRREVLAGG